MMDSRHSVTLALLVTLLGCGGCQPDEAPVAADAAQAVEEAAPAPGSSPPAQAAAAPADPDLPAALPDPSSVNTPPKGIDSRSFAPEIALKRLGAGGTWRLSDIVGPTQPDSKYEAVVVAFMASWCGVCKTALPTLVEMQQTYGDRVAFAIVAVDDTDAGMLQELAIVQDSGLDAVVLAADTATRQAYLGKSKNIPRFYFINKVGQILVQDRGFGSKVKPLIPKQIRVTLNNPGYVKG